MRNTHARTTLVVQQFAGDGLVATDTERVLLLDSVAAACFLIRTHALEMSLDVDRVIVDRSATSLECLQFLATLPPEFAGDILFLLDGQHAFLSATGRGGDRLLYALSQSDVAFYLAAQGLFRREEPVAVRKTA